MVYQQYESDTSSSSSGSRTGSSASSYSGSEGHLSLQYADDGTYTSEHDRELEEIDVHSPRQVRAARGDLELFEDEGIRGARDDEEYSEHDIPKPTNSGGLAYYVNAVKTYDYKGAVNKGVDAVLDFDWSERKNQLKVLYFVLGFIAFVLIVHLPSAASKRKAAAKALAAATVAPSIEVTNTFTEISGTGTYAPSRAWWPDEQIGMYNGTVYPSSTFYPTVEWWPHPNKQKPWYEGSYEPTVWSSTDAPMSEEEKAALLQAAIEAEEKAAEAEKAAQEAEDAAKAAEEAVENASGPRQPNMPGFARPGGAIPTNAPTIAPTPTLAPTTGEPTTAAPVAWYVNWEGTWAPTLWSETSTWAPTTWMPTSTDVSTPQNATGVQDQLQEESVVDVETLGGN